MAGDRPAGVGLRRARVLAVLLLLAHPLTVGPLLLTGNGWAVNRANVWVWSRVTDVPCLRGQVTPEQFAVLANVLLFVPALAALALLYPRWWWVLVGAGISAAVELHQYTQPGRDTSVLDVLANTAGAAIGVTVGILLHRGLSGAAGSAAPAPSGPTTPVAARPGTDGARGGASDDRG